jgi:hypothetical protein
MEGRLTNTFVLGASDPEMGEIERLLISTGKTVIHASAGGRRVHPGNGYTADPVSGLVVAVECDGEGWTVADRVDHHRPGDPGYGQPPGAFLKASSLGQILALLSITPSDEHRLIAAADHCLAAAYRGGCPGVSPVDLRDWRIATRAAFQRRSEAEVLAEVEAARRVLAAAPRIDIAGIEVADLRQQGIVPELPEAAAFDGVPFLALLLDRGQTKVVLQAAPPEVIATWMHEQELCSRKPYGDPARGFAGVIIW